MAVVGNEVSSEHFTYSTESKTFSAFASELGGVTLHGRLFDDACDQGFVMRSSKTGKRLPFYYEGEVRDGGGELVGWRFKSYHRDGCYNAYSLMVFNT